MQTSRTARSGTSGWDYMTPADTTSLPYNNPALTNPPPLLTWPTMADVLEDAGIPWKCYSVADGSIRYVFDRELNCLVH